MLRKRISSIVASWYISSASNMPKKRSDHKFSLVLPVLFYEYLAISITKSLLPRMIVEYYGDWSYLVVGMIETAKGCLAFLSCPIFGRLSDRIGRKYCLLVTVIGTTLPVCMMAFTDNMIVYAVMMSLSGFFRWSNRKIFLKLSELYCIYRGSHIETIKKRIGSLYDQSWMIVI